MQPSPQRIEEIYPRYSKHFLKIFFTDYFETAVEYLTRTGRGHYELQHAMNAQPLAGADKERIAGKKVCAMSLFFKPATSNRHNNVPSTNDDGTIPLSVLEASNHPSVEGTFRFQHSFLENYVNKVVNSDFGDWVPVIYLAKDLLLLAPRLRDHGFIVIMMNHNGIAHSPGSLWRYLSFNLNCNSCYLQDTDRPFYMKRADQLHDVAERNSGIAVVRSLQWTATNGEMALILGNDFLVRPALIDFNAAEMMLGYFALNILHEDRITNLCHEPTRNRDDGRVTPLSQRRKREHPGPLPHERVPHKCFPYYPFDEQWLKEFVYYHLSDGRIATLLHKNLRENDIAQSLDLIYQKQRGNLILV